MRWIFVVFVMIGTFAGVPLSAQTDTPTPTETPAPTLTPTQEPFVYATIQPQYEGTPGQMSRFDYVTNAGDVQIANLLTWLLYSIWGFFIFAVVVYARRKR